MGQKGDREGRAGVKRQWVQRERQRAALGSAVRRRFLEGLYSNTVYAYRGGQGQREEEFLTEQRLLYPPHFPSASSQKGQPLLINSNMKQTLTADGSRGRHPPWLGRMPGLTCSLDPGPLPRTPLGNRISQQPRLRSLALGHHPSSHTQALWGPERQGSLPEDTQQTRD